MTGDRTAISDGHRCRWHAPGGRCPGPQAFPGSRDVPPFCVDHLRELEPWVVTRAIQPASAVAWIDWAARRAQHVQAVDRMLGGRGVPQ
jgi:hypothetical protein